MNENANSMMGMSAFEQFMMADKTSRHRASGVAVTGLVLGSVGLAAGIGAWIFAPIYANARTKAAEAQNAGTSALLNQMAGLLNTERAERVAQGMTISQTITDSISGQQSGSQSQAQTQTTAIDQTMQNIMQQTLMDAITGKSSLNATPVQLYSAPQPCGCPGCGCGQ